MGGENMGGEEGEKEMVEGGDAKDPENWAPSKRMEGRLEMKLGRER